MSIRNISGKTIAICIHRCDHCGLEKTSKKKSQLNECARCSRSYMTTRAITLEPGQTASDYHDSVEILDSLDVGDLVYRPGQPEEIGQVVSCNYECGAAAITVEWADEDETHNIEDLVFAGCN